MGKDRTHVIVQRRTPACTPNYGLAVKVKSSTPPHFAAFSCNAFSVFPKIQVLLFLGRREEGEGVVHTDVSGDSRTEKEKRRFHETFLIFLKKTNNGENVALSNFDSSRGGVKSSKAYPVEISRKADTTHILNKCMQKSVTAFLRGQSHI